MSKSAALGIIFLVEFGLGLWQFKPYKPTSTKQAKKNLIYRKSYSCQMPIKTIYNKNQSYSPLSNHV